MKRIAVIDDYQGVALAMADWSVLDGRATVDVFHDNIAEEDRLVARLEPYDIIVAMRERTPFRRSLLERLPNLDLLVTTGPFNAVIDLEAAAELGVTVCGTSRGTKFKPQTGELTWGLILACVKQIPQIDADLRKGAWQTRMTGDLCGTRLGVLGLGNYGKMSARLGKAFDMDVVAWSENLTPERCAEVGAKYVPKDELIATSDVITIHLVLSPRTRGLIGEKELRAMKRTAYLVNTSRGPIVDEAALVHALETGEIAGAGLDVFETEPLPPDHPFRRLDNAIVTPHVGYVTPQTYESFYGDVVEDIDQYLNGVVIRPCEPAPATWV